MKRLFIILAVLLAATQLQAQKFGKAKPETDANEWNDRDVASFNLLNARTNIVAYSDENAIESRNYEDSPYYVSLDGTWLMKLDKGVSSLGDGIGAKTFNTDGWLQVTLPTYQWIKKGVPVKAPQITNPSELPSGSNYVASYYKEFNVTKSWSDYNAILRLQARSALYVWVNNQYVGYAEDSRSLNEFDITPYLKPGKMNNLIVQVVGSSNGSLLEMSAPSTLNGITGHVAITLEPKVHVSDYAISSDFEPRSGIGAFELSLWTENKSAKGKYYVEVELWDPAGKSIDKMGKWIVFDKRTEVKVKLDREILNAKSWSEDHPNLYTAVIRLRDENMQAVEILGSRFGFRHVEMQDGVLTLNGKEITLRGVVYNNYMYSDGGEPSREQIRSDIELMKRHNVNAIRTRLLSPAADYLYELCDEYGMYVVCDANIYPFTGTSKAIATDNEYADLFAGRVLRMYDHYKNYASILVWSLGDGEGNGVCMENAYKALKMKDKTRPVVYAGAEFSANTDIIGGRSTDVDMMRQYLAKQSTRPMILIGFPATQGNGFGGMENVWQLVRQNRRMQGGFIQNWNDVVRYDAATGKDVSEMGLVRSNGTHSPVLSELRELYRPFDITIVNVGPDAYEFNVTNFANFAKMSDYQVEYNIYSNLKPRIIEGDVNVNLEPGESKNFKLKIPKLTLYAGEDLYIKFTIKQKKQTTLVPKGTLLATISYPLPMYSKSRQPMPDYDKIPITIADAPNNHVVLSNANFELDYDLDHAEINAYSFEGKQVLVSPAELDFWREPTDNDKLDKNAYRLWMVLSHMNREVIAANCRLIDDYCAGIDVMMRYSDHNGATLMDVKQTIQVLYTGDVVFNNEIVASELVKGLPRIGMRFELAKEYNLAEWYGMGNETYADRKQSGLVGIYTSPVAEMGYDYGQNQENGNRSNVVWCAVRNQTKGFFVDMLDSTYNFSVKPSANGVYLNVDHMVAGIGNAISGSPIEDKYLIRGKKFAFRVHVRPYNTEVNDARDFSLIAYPAVQSGVLPMPIISKNRERFDAPMQVTMRSEADKSEIRYTLDGTVPDEKSILYKGPITIKSSTVVKARTFRKGSTTSFTTTQVYNYDYISSISYEHKANTPYNYKSESVLFDGEIGTVNDLSRGWIGFSGSDFSAVLELGKNIELDQVVLRFAHVPDAWVFAPKSVDVYTSEDGTNFNDHFVATIPYDPADIEMNSSQLQTVKVNVSKPNVRYVKVVARNLGKVPKWHKAKGLNAWIMIDEIQLNEVIK